ncbi:hypothetical protein ACQKM1_03490 [Peribacillus frigoritolerans]
MENDVDGSRFKKLKRHDEFHHKDQYDDVDDVINRSLVMKRKFK